MNREEKNMLLQVRDKIDRLLLNQSDEEETIFIGTFYGEIGKYDLYLFPKSTEKIMNWYEAKKYCRELNGDLPTIGELQYIYENNLNLTFEYYNYWSSVEYDGTNSLYYGFNGNFVDDASNYNNYLTRAVKRNYYN